MSSTVTTSQPTHTTRGRSLFPARVRRNMPLLVAIAEQMPWISGNPGERLAAARRLLAEVVASHEARPRGRAMFIRKAMALSSPDGR